MHELGLMQSVLAAVEESATAAGATRVLEVRICVGEMTEAVVEALEFAFEALSSGTLCEGAKLEASYIKPHSRCRVCGNEYDHDRYHISCPACGSFNVELLAGRDLYIDSIEVELPVYEPVAPTSQGESD